MKYGVDQEMNRVIGTLESIDPSTEIYEKTVKNLETLSKIKEAKRFKINWEPVIEGIVRISIVILVLNFEKLDVISTKAMNYMKK